MRRLAALVIALGTIAADVHAQDCSALAAVIGRESERFSDQNQVEAQKKANLCTSAYESATTEQKAQIEASYKLFSGGVSGSNTQIQEMQSSRCENQFGSYWHNKVTSSEVQRVSQIGAGVIQACLNSQSFRVVDIQINGEATVASFRFGGAGDTTINGIFVTPAEMAQCSVGFDGSTYADVSALAGKTLRSGEVLTLNCQRQPQNVAVPGDTRKLFAGGVLSVSTVSNTASVPLIEYAVPPLPTAQAEALARRIDELRDATQQASQRIEDLGKRAGDLEAASVLTKPGGEACVLVKVDSCPAGWVAQGPFGIIQRSDLPRAFNQGGHHTAQWYWQHGTLCCGK